MKYTTINKQTGVVPSTATPMNYAELMDMVNTFVSFNSPKKQDNTDEAKIAYYNRRSFYKIVEA